jgi:RimJ/RimL family protein N-acetyltransferase
VPRKREPARPIGLGLSGSWIQLEPPTATNGPEFERAYRVRELDPAMGGGARSTPGAIVPPMLIRVRSSGEAVGVVENHPLPGGVAVFVVYLDRRRARAGFATEAIILYLSHLFDSGARLVTAEVLEFNADMIGVLRKVHIAPQARLREHSYSAGRFWDLLVYSFGREEWMGIVERYRRYLPGGDRRPVALGSTRPPD